MTLPMNSHLTADNSRNAFSQDFLLEIINSISDPIFVKDRQHRLVFLNDAYCRFAGYTPEEAIAKSDVDFFSAEEADISWEKDELIFTSGVTSEDEEYFTDARGKTYIISTKKSLFKDASNNTFLVTTIKEITASEKKQPRKQKSKNLAEDLFKVISNLLIFNDFNKSINTTLACLGSATDVDKVSIILEKTYEIAELTLIDRRFKWSNNDTQIEIYIFPQWYEILFRGETIAGSVNEFPELERDILQAKNISSILVIPIKVAGEFWGCIYFATCEKERQWLDNEKYILQAVTECLGGAIYQYLRQEKLRKSKRFLQFVVNSLPQMIFWKDFNSVFLGCNQKLAEVRNFSYVEEIVGKTDDDICASKEQSNWYRESDKRVMESGVAELHITEMKQQADGKQVWLDTNKIPLRDEKGNVIGVLATIEDITQRKQIEKTLLQQEEFLRTIYDGVELVIVVYEVTEDNNFIYFGINKATELTSGFKSQQVVGKTPREVFGDEFGGAIEERNQNCLLSGKSVSFEEKIIAQDKEIFLLTTLTPLRDEQEKIYRIIGTSTNITAQKQAEKALKKAYEEMENLVSERTKELTLTNLALKAEIEERKNMQAALQETEAKVQKLAANVPGMLYQMQLNSDGSISFPFVSSGCDEIYGLKPEEIQADANSIISMIHPNDLKAFKTSLAISAKNLKPWKNEGRIILPSGEIKWIKSSYRPEKLENGTILCNGLILDITQRKQAEKALLRSNAMLQAQQEAAIDGILVVDENQNILSCNQRFVDLWPIPQTVIESGNEKQFLEYIVEKFTNLGEFIVRSENLSHDVEKSISDEIDLGDGRTFERYCAPVSSLMGEYYGKIFYFRDISQRKQAETKLRQQTQELEKTLLQLQRTQVQLIQSEKMSSLGQLVAGIAHEINNPINFISANLTYTESYFEDLLTLINFYNKNYSDNSEVEEIFEEIEFDYLQEDLPNIIKSMKTGAERIRQIVLSLRIFSRLDEAEIKQIDIHESIDSTLMILHSSLESQSHRAIIKVIKEYGDLPLVECYAGKLNQVFLNILNNAIDALEEGSKNQQIPDNECAKIIISTQLLPDNIVQINISDNGSGIPEENLSKLFDPFFTTKPVGKGTGLGLSMSYQIIVEQHQGQLNCISTLGKGTEFQIQIP
ncbi:MAG: PAS domain S-box protein, partial [Cyanobacteria bacterium P01_A01_bin.68]